MTNTPLCRCCNHATNPILSGTLINHQVSYFECPVCLYVQTQTPHWLDQAYSKAINDSDTGIMMRNQANARMVLATLWMLGSLDDTLVDCAGGYGILVRILRDYGINALWSDPYCQNLMARGFEHAGEPAALVTAFEAFEHFVNPSDELEHLLAIAPNLLFSTEIIASPAPQLGDWWYYGRDHGQHIGFFRILTLKRMAKEHGKYLSHYGKIYHLMTDKPIHPAFLKMVFKANRLIPYLLRTHLKSKTWSDHRVLEGINT